MTSFCSLVLYFCFNFMLLFSFYCFFCFFFFFFFKQKTAYEMRISDWSSDVCSSDLLLSGLIVTLPLAPWVTAATVSAPPPGLLSLPRTSMTSALSSVPVAVSFCASGDAPPAPPAKLGSASCGERVCQYVEISVVAVALTKKKHKQHISENKNT